MQTHFTPIQLQRLEVAEAQSILASCQHFGFCTAGCPTYVLSGDENEGPRGRIDLIRAMLEAGGAPDAKTVGHIDRCLSCMSCMTTCAVRVDYRHLVDLARAHIEVHHRRRWDERLVRALLGAVLPRPSWLRLALRAAPLGRALQRIVPPIIAARLRPLLDMTPQSAPPTEPRLVGEHPTPFPRRGRVLLLAGCAQRVLSPGINAATIRMLHRAGYDVCVPPAAGCCGSLELHLGRESRALAAARSNVRAWAAEIERADVAAIVINASGCGSTVKDYAHLLRHDVELAPLAVAVGALARDVCEFLASVALPPPQAPRRYTVAVHDACSLRNVQRVTDAPRTLLQRAGYLLREIPEGHFCCGSAGTYNLLEPEIAAQLGARKARHIAGTRAEIVAAANIGCVVQIARHAARPVVHTVELLDWAWGGPRPPALEGIAPTEQPASEPDVPAAGMPAPNAIGDPTATGIW